MSAYDSSRRRHTRCGRDWSSDVCSSDLRRKQIPSIGCIGCQGSNHTTQLINADTDTRHLQKITFLLFTDVRSTTKVKKSYSGRCQKVTQIGRASCRERVKNADVGV